MDLVELLLRASFIVKLVLVGLLVLSVFSWSVILAKQYALQRAAKESAVFMDALETGMPWPRLVELAQTLPSSPLAGVVRHLSTLKAGLSPDRIRSATARAMVHQTQQLHSHLILLATTGSSAPFIGLFGTVLGIVNAFQRIGATGSASLAVVAPGIAEALVTTAAGLAAAIPAVAAYNHQTNQAAQLTAEAEAVLDELPGLVTGRHG